MYSYQAQDEVKLTFFLSTHLTDKRTNIVVYRGNALHTNLVF